MTMNRVLISLLFVIYSLSLMAQSITLPDEDIKYKIMYKWGLVNTQAGHATLSLRNKDGRYQASLVAHSEPWADRIYRVRDTLLCTMTPQIEPLKYEKIAHEDGKFTHDIVTYSRQNDIVTANCVRHKQKAEDEPIKIENRSLTASGTTVDMLSVFYYLRTLDFPSMKKGATSTINIFSGKKKEKLTIKYNGYSSVDIDNKLYYAYHVSFRFTSDNGKKSSDDIDTWISADSKRIPIKLEGRLPIGKVRCFYTK